MKNILIVCLLLGISSFFTSCEKEVIVMEPAPTNPHSVVCNDYWGPGVARLLEWPSCLGDQLLLNIDGSFIEDDRGMRSYLTSNIGYCETQNVFEDLIRTTNYPIFVEYYVTDGTIIVFRVM
jgi:hypothetical protein